ncbi:MAG: hypothetical protein KAY22_06660 [Rhizorhabdus sp.]|uniref:DNA N-6-adenine-methyltransferase n=1 Tax=Rhizorhabdus sp. TaxID=1968843 RepID=UPI001B531505|nr:DNA N-6-adenine-methyltransferase [Rhizorhabdus sp.]MBP8231970.1 hypothetical protein [Rhizorhabdus sp.]
MTLGSHQTSIGKSQVHLTPRWLLDQLGPFDLDPCAATVRPWDCAAENYVEAIDGLAQPWKGLVWLNPPFDRRLIGRWLAKLAEHGQGIALVHARTETAWFRQIWTGADLILFLGHRVNFLRPDGSAQPANSGAPIALAGYGEGANRLRNSDLPGTLVTEWAA